MYRPSLFREDRIEVMHGLIRAHPFATVVTVDGDGLAANHLPLVLDPAASERGTLKGHVARANPIWSAHDSGVEALLIFQGPHHYISPSWYPSKKDHGKVVPTWNYAVVHAWGSVRLHEEPEWLLAHLTALTAQQEAGRADSWAVGDAPADFIAAQMKGIVGFEIPIARIEGKWKVSQNRSETDRRGVVDGLEAEGTVASLEMTRLIPR